MRASGMMRSFNCGWSYVVAVTMGLSITTAAFAQRGQQVIVNDDGDGPQVMRFSMPDLESLRQPDYLREDLPIFTETLVLSDPQQAMAGRQIDSYLERFQALIEEILRPAVAQRFGGGPAGGAGNGGPVGRPGAGPGGGPGGDALGMLALGGDEGPEAGLRELENELPPGSRLGVEVQVGMDMGGGDGEGGAGGGGGRPVPRPNVGISVETPDGTDISPELRSKLEDKAREIGERISKQIQEQMARAMQGGGMGGAGGAGGEGGDGPRLPMADPEEMRKRQQDLLDAIEAFRKQRDALRQQFILEVQANLAEPQIERWPALERAIQRERSLPRGRISGERADLVKLVNQLKLDESALSRELREIVEAYEISLDSALKQRDEFLKKSEPQVDRLLDSGEAEKALKLVDRGISLRTSIRAINEQFADAIAGALPEAHAASFRAAVRSVSYPHIYRETAGQKAFAKGAAMEGLSEAQRADLADLRQAYAGELDAMNAQLREVVDRYEPQQPREALIRSEEALARLASGERFEPREGEGAAGDEGRGGRAGPDFLREELGDNPVRTLFDRRYELESRYYDALTALLGPERAAELPALPKRVDGPIVIRAAR